MNYVLTELLVVASIFTRKLTTTKNYAYVAPTAHNQQKPLRNILTFSLKRDERK